MNWDELEYAFWDATDKFENGYGPVYRKIWEELSPAARVLEVGVWHGGSLRLWKAAFPDGLIAGADDNHSLGPSTWPYGTVKIVAGQDSPTLASAARIASPDGWDLVIDDASHIGSLSRATFSLLWPQVVPGGWYVFEDWAVGVPGNDPYYGCYNGTSQLDFAQDLLARAGRLPTRDDADIEEFFGRMSIIALRKRRTRKSGLDKVADAIQAARGGPAPVQIRGYA